MQISGFTIARNVLKFNYPILESIQSILPICDEFVINVGDSEDGTLEFLKKNLLNPKIRYVENVWDFSQKALMLSHQTNLALAECKGDWAFYVQSDEVVHEDDLSKLRSLMEKNLDDESIDVFRFRWLHFYGSYYRYRIDHGWYQKQDRIVRNNGKIKSTGDAWGFEREDGKDLQRVDTGCFIYHYGWVQPQDVMQQRRENADKIGFIELKESQRADHYEYGDLNRFPAYFGSHPKVMENTIAGHELSQKDKEDIRKKYWWHPLMHLGVRYKTGKRVKERIT